jgi:hypothetical protein
MTVLREALRIELAALVAGFAAVLAWKILRGAVRWVRHPESREALGGWRTGALRLQMPAASLLIAFLYLVQLPQSAASCSLPPVPEYALALLAGSQGVFLAVMARRLLRPFGFLRNVGEK